MRILVVEDEKKVAHFIKKGLEEEAYAVDLTYDGEEALYLGQQNDYDLIILDIMLPKKDGFSVLTALREKGILIPVLILSARTSVEDRVRGLDLGGDDYLMKPFSFLELLARVRALLRRGKKETTLLKVRDLTLDPASRKVFRGEKEIELTQKEFALLEYFMRNKNQVLTRTMITEHVWNYNFDSFTNVIDVYVNYLRNKIDKDNPSKLIQTVRGVGYMMEEE